MNERETYIKARLAAAGVIASSVENISRRGIYLVHSTDRVANEKLKLHGFAPVDDHPASPQWFHIRDLHIGVKGGLDADPGPAADFHPPADLVKGVATALAEPAAADDDTREFSPIPPVDPEYRIPEDYEELRQLVAVQHAQLEEAGHQVLEAIQAAVSSEQRCATLRKVNQAQSEMLRDSLAELGVKPRVEIKTLVRTLDFDLEPSNEELADHLNDGWHIEHIGITSTPLGTHGDTFTQRVVTLSRPVAPPRPQPSVEQDARAAVEIPAAATPVEDPAPQPVIVAHQRVGVSLNGLPLAQEIRLHGLDVWKSGMNAELFTDAQAEYVRKLDELHRLGGPQPLRALPSSN